MPLGPAGARVTADTIHFELSGETRQVKDLLGLKAGRLLACYGYYCKDNAPVCPAFIRSLNFTHPGNGAPTYMIHSFHTPFGRVNLTVVVPWLNALNVPNWLTYPTVGSLEVQVPFDPVT
jgi:hypothetical protein